MGMRVYVRRKLHFNVEEQQTLHEFQHVLGIRNLTDIAIFIRYDIDGMPQEAFNQCLNTVLSDPVSDVCTTELPHSNYSAVFGVEFLPGQFDQRADSASECIQLINPAYRPDVHTAKIYCLSGDISSEQLARIKRHLINPVECQEISDVNAPWERTSAGQGANAGAAEDETSKGETSNCKANASSALVETISGFISFTSDELHACGARLGLSIDDADLACAQAYFAREQRDPTITELKVIDTYWSDHCRHTTFETQLNDIRIDDPTIQATYNTYMSLRNDLHIQKPVRLMDIATVAAKYLVNKGVLTNLDISDEINACTTHVTVDVDGELQDWLFLFKNETHNHPTEIEPFGGAATCIGGCIRDPLSGRAYVYQAMRVTGSADPRTPLNQTLPGKLPQRTITTMAQAGYSSYGNQIGLATGLVHELYHPGYRAKRMEVGACVGAVPASHVKRRKPQAGDVIVLVGGRTGRDGIGGASGSSKQHTQTSLSTCGAEVQKGNAPVERKIQRLFRNPNVSRMIIRCNDFGAGGVSVAVCEIADGVTINLNRVPKKYSGLTGTELALSESQERMAVALASEDVEPFLHYAHEENLEATPIATVTDAQRVIMNWNNTPIISLSREFLNSNGAKKHARVHITPQAVITRPCVSGETPQEKLTSRMQSLMCCSQKGLGERFDSTIGAGSIFMPFGGKTQQAPIQAMVSLFPTLGKTHTISAMAWGANPFLLEENVYAGAYAAILESVSKLIATGISLDAITLSLQEYFGSLRNDPKRWGCVAAALLGALQAQLDLECAAIGGKDSMSGSFEQLDVPPTLLSFAAGTGQVNNIVSPEFKEAEHVVALLTPHYISDYEGVIPQKESVRALFESITHMQRKNALYSCKTCSYGGVAETLFTMGVGNKLGIRFSDAAAQAYDTLFSYAYGSFVVEVSRETYDTLLNSQAADTQPFDVSFIGTTTNTYTWIVSRETIALADVQNGWETTLEEVFSTTEHTIKRASHNENTNKEMRNKEIEAYNTNQSRNTCTDNATKAQNNNLTQTPASIELPCTQTHKHTTRLGAPRVLIPVFPGTNCEYDMLKAFNTAGARSSILVINDMSASDIHESVDRMVKALAQSQILALPGGFSGGDEPDGSAKLICAFFRNPYVTEAVRNLLQKQDGLILGICNGFQALIKLGLVPYGDICERTASCPTLTNNTIGKHISSLVYTRVAHASSPWLAQMHEGDVHSVPISHGEGRFYTSQQLLDQLVCHNQIAFQYCDAQGVVDPSQPSNPNGSLMAIEGIISPEGRVLGKMGHTERSGALLYKNIPYQHMQPLIEGGVSYFL